MGSKCVVTKPSCPVVESRIRDERAEVLDVLVGDVIGEAIGVICPSLFPEGREIAARQGRKSLMFGPQIDSLLQQSVDLLLGWENLVVQGARCD